MKEILISFFAGAISAAVVLYFVVKNNKGYVKKWIDGLK